jgi:hypothetical protein
MKPKNYAIFLLIPFMLFSCKSSKSLTKVNKSTPVEIPLSGKQYQTDKDFFRAKQSGNSPDLATAKKIALQNSKDELAGSIKTIVKNTTDQYTSQRTFADKKEFENRFEERILSSRIQELNDVKIIGEQVLKEKDGTYTYWIAIETSKLSVQNNLQKQISSDEKLQLDYDKAEFMKIFDAEMDKLEKSQK